MSETVWNFFFTTVIYNHFCKFDKMVLYWIMVLCCREKAFSQNEKMQLDFWEALVNGSYP